MFSPVFDASLCSNILRIGSIGTLRGRCPCQLWTSPFNIILYSFVLYKYIYICWHFLVCVNLQYSLSLRSGVVSKDLVNLYVVRLNLNMAYAVPAQKCFVFSL